MRRVMMLTLFFLLAAFGLYGVLSYTEMSVSNPTIVAITEPKDSLIAVELTNQSSHLTMTSGDTVEDFMRITNNVGENTTFYLYEKNGFDVLVADTTMLAADDWSSVHVAGNLLPGDYTLEIVLHAEWLSGSAEIKLDNIYVTIEESVVPGGSTLEESLDNNSDGLPVEDERQVEDEMLDDGMPKDDASGENHSETDTASSELETDSQEETLIETDQNDQAITQP